MFAVDAEQNVRSTAPAAYDRRERHSQTCVTTPTLPPPSPAAVDRHLLSSSAAGAASAMFASKLATTSLPDQYEQFIRLQQLLMHLQTAGLPQPSDNGTQVRLERLKDGNIHMCFSSRSGYRPFITPPPALGN